MTFLLSEDSALRKHLQGIVVHDQKATGDANPRQVAVFFGQPDQELRAQVYPYITIDMINVSRDSEREMRGFVAGNEKMFGYLGPTEIDYAVNGWEVELPIPVNIDYQVTTYSRHPRHDREIISQLLYAKLPLRFGQIDLDDNTVRRIEVLDVTKRDMTEQAKRLFINAVTVRVTSEVVQATYNQLYKVQTVALDELTVIRDY